MKNIDIIYNNRNALPVIKIDGQDIDKYSDLKLLEEKHIHLLGNKLPRILRAEAEGDYNLRITGNAFAYKICKALLESSNECKGITFQEATDVANIGKEAAFIFSLLRKYGKSDQYVPMISLSGSQAGSINHPYVQIVSENANWRVEDMADNVDHPTVIVNAETLKVKISNGQPVIFLPENDINDFCDYIYERTILIPAMENADNECKKLPLSEEEKLTLAAYRERKTKYLLELGSSEIEYGSKCFCKFRVYPVENSSDYLLDIQPKGAATVENDYLNVNSGNAISVRVLNSNGIIQEEHLIDIIYRKYVEDIKVFPEVLNVVIGEKASFEMYPIPSDAEDIKDIKVVAEDANIISITNNRVAVGLAEGTTEIKIIAKNIVKRIPVSVKPKLQGISLSQSSCNIELGKTVELRCNINPTGAACETPEWRMDNTKLGTLNPKGMTCTYTATKDGLEKGKIICTIPGTEFEDSCEVQVQPIKQPTALIALSWIFTSIGCVVGLFVFPAAAAGGSAFMGYFMDFFMPVGLVLALIGRSMNNEHSNGNFTGCILLNVLFSLGMILIGSIACGGLK